MNGPILKGFDDHSRWSSRATAAREYVQGAAAKIRDHSVAFEVIDMRIDDGWDDRARSTVERTYRCGPWMKMSMTWSFLAWMIKMIATQEYGDIRWMKLESGGYWLAISPRGDSWLAVRTQVMAIFDDAPRPEHVEATVGALDDDGE